MAPKRRHDDLMVALLASGRTIRETARLCSLNEKTVSRRLAEAEFAGKVASARAQLAADATGKLASLLNEAADTLQALLGSAMDAVRLAAARSIFDSFTKMVELTDTQKRLAEVEAFMKRTKDVQNSVLDNALAFVRDRGRGRRCCPPPDEVVGAEILGRLEALIPPARLGEFAEAAEVGSPERTLADAWLSDLEYGRSRLPPAMTAAEFAPLLDALLEPPVPNEHFFDFVCAMCGLGRPSLVDRDVLRQRPTEPPTTCPHCGSAEQDVGHPHGQGTPAVVGLARGDAAIFRRQGMTPMMTLQEFKNRLLEKSLDSLRVAPAVASPRPSARPLHALAK